MLLFLAGILEQLDLAAEHIAKREVHDSRFGLMLTDNALELVLHQIAKGKQRRLNLVSFTKKVYQHQSALDKAMGRSFDAKVGFARVEGGLSDAAAQTILAMHEFRNELYHIGLQHDAIFPELASFYFDVTARYLATYTPDGLWYSSDMVLPERSKKYFKGTFPFPVDVEDFGKACHRLVELNAFEPAALIRSLADHLDQLIEEQDTCISIVADGVYEKQRMTRDRAVVELQAWRLALSEEGLAFARERGFQGNLLQLASWLADHYSFRIKRDPIASWRKRAARLRAGGDPYRAFATYNSFMAETAEIREQLSSAASQVEEEIDRLVDQARGK